MTTLDILQPVSPTLPVRTSGKSPAPDQLDISRGARARGMRPSPVFIEWNVLEDYSELDPALGHNVIGSILTVLASQLAAYPGGVPDEKITVDLIRREDSRPVEVELKIIRTRRMGIETLLLRRTGERVVEGDQN